MQGAVVMGCAVIAVFFLPIEVIYAQDELNKAWRAGAQG